ncbi:MAG: sulfatase-like hydrolase/transferase [Chloroflexota bacterium]|jgi:choline-sulfatase|nr:sulfatase-like hydrolase/transferase [Chloroflexota bacterium]MDP6509011.1 sulfatase-like hydrolase/transferase [Chloroflexota bacterium]MDP6756842.1 sulfatase-like hydrolase/transferase [Chloroflexota bacterium]
MARPNFLIFMTDEHDPGVSSPYGHPFMETPAMQRMADAGAVFENAYCNSPLCVPSRSSFMTGKHLHRIRVWNNSMSLGSDQPTWAHRMRAAGYETCLAGKMHFVGPDQMHGFDRRIVPEIHGLGGGDFGLTDWDVGRMKPNTIRLHDDPGPGPHPHMDHDDEVVRQSTAFLSEPERQEKPWVLCSSIFTPHYPFIARPEYYYNYYPEHADLPDIPEGHLEDQHPQSKRLREYFSCNGVPEEQVRKARAAYYGLVEFADSCIGHILDSLESNGLADNTVVIYVADHGEMNGEHGMWFKCSFYEQASRIPLIIYWPGVTEAGSRFDQVTSLLDVVQTMLDIGEADATGTDGISLQPLLRGDDEDAEGIAFCEYEAHGTDRAERMVRRGRYKLNYYHGEPPELFDLEDDPGEMNDLAADPASAGIVQELTALVLDGWDPDAIEADVRHRQDEIKIVVDGMDGKPWGPSWRRGRFA